MPWKAQLEQAVYDAETDIVYITASFVQLDDKEEVISSSAKTWKFMRAEAPDAEALADLMSAELKKVIKFRSALLDYESLKGSPIKEKDFLASMFPVKVKYVSVADRKLIAMKEAVKPDLIKFIKKNPACSLDEALVYVEKALGLPFRGIAMALEAIYREGALQAGLIIEDTFEAFRDWVVITPEETILSF